MDAGHVEIAGRKIGPGEPCYVIAEAGVNHNGSLDRAKELVDVAASAGADVVKFQTFKADRVVTESAPKADYALETTDVSESHLEMMRSLELTPEMHQPLIDYCNEKGITFVSSPFDHESADLLESLDVPAFKIPSGEITNIPFLEHIARKGKPMIVSTGMAYLSEVEIAVRAIQAAGNDQILLMHCVSNYPADPANVNLRAMHTMAAAFNIPVGYSDHTVGIEVPIAAVALGASLIEKHFTLDRNLPGPDHRASLEPDELAAMVKGIQIAQSALGHGRKEPNPSEQNTADVARKSLVAERDIAAGETLTEDSVGIRRPGTGIPPVMKSQIVGRTARTDIASGDLITLEMLH